MEGGEAGNGALGASIFELNAAVVCTQLSEEL